jgi:hypothetical protein
MAHAGDRLVAGRIPGEWIGGIQVTLDSATFTTTEVVVMAVQVPVMSGRTYDVIANAGFASDVDDDLVLTRLNQDSLVGATFQRDYIEVAGAGSTARGFKAVLRGTYTATVTENKTFVVTADRLLGTGNCVLKAAADHPCSIDAYYRSG